MKTLIAVLTLFFLVLQYKLWLEPDGVWRVQSLRHQIAAQTQENLKLGRRNERLISEIKDLKTGSAALEVHARNDLNMIKPDELFYRIVDKDQQDHTS